MRILTLTCDDCGTIIAANALEEARSMKCPRIDCQNTLQFDDLGEEARRYFLANAEKYDI